MMLAEIADFMSRMKPEEVPECWLKEKEKEKEMEEEDD
jgi:hypothetical protein